MPSKIELASATPYIRHYASVLLGNDAYVGELIDRAVEDIVSLPSAFKAWDAKQSLFVAFHRQLSADGIRGPSAVPRGRNDASSIRLQRMDLLTRSATLLQVLMGYAPDEISTILGIDKEEVDRLAGEGLAELSIHEPTAVLIIEDNPVISSHLEQIVTGMGHKVSAIATTRQRAVEEARKSPPGLVLADIELADGSSGIDAVNDIFEERRCPTIFITAYPERLLTGERPQPTYLITKPFQAPIVQSAITQSLLFAEIEEPESAAELTPIPARAVAAMNGPVGAEVASGKLRLIDASFAQTRVSPDGLEELRQDHLATATRLCGSLTGSNVGPGFNARLEAVRKTLKKRLSEERGLQLAIHSRGLEMMMPQIAERLDDVTAADVAAFVSDLVELSRQFPMVRKFVEEARSLEIDGKSHDAAVEIANVIIDQPATVVEPELKNALMDLKAAAADGNEPVSELGLLRAVGNILRAIGRALNRRVLGIKASATKSFDDTLGETLGKGLARLVSLAAAGGALWALSAALPKEFGFAAALIKLARAIQP